MSSLEASIANEPPQEKLQASSSPTMFSSLPYDLLLNIVARVPKRYYPILACVSKNLGSLVRSPDIHKRRSLLGKDSLFIGFRNVISNAMHCYTLRRTHENSTTENIFASIDFVYPPELDDCPSFVAVGSEIFFAGGRFNPSSSLWIINSRSGEWRQGPSMLSNRTWNSAGLVGGKIYVIGGNDEIPAEVFDLKTQTWKVAPILEDVKFYKWTSTVSVALDGKVCALYYLWCMLCYVTKDGSCEISNLPDDRWWAPGVCVIDNVFYVYFLGSGLKWYDSELKLWKDVDGLDLGEPQSVGMAEYYGKLAFIWEKPSLVSSERKEIWCRMIGLVRDEEKIHGTAEPSQLLECVSSSYQMFQCLSLSD